MSTVICPEGNGMTLVGKLCYSSCPANYMVRNNDVISCVANTPCPDPLVEDVLDNSICIKTEIVRNDDNDENFTCPIGYTLWFPGECYKNCPPGYIDTGTTCVKRTADRISATPACSSDWYEFDTATGSCIFSVRSVLLVFSISLLAFLIIIIFFMLFFYNSSIAASKKRCAFEKQY
jgi:hypothetical protein